MEEKKKSTSVKKENTKKQTSKKITSKQPTKTTTKKTTKSTSKQKKTSTTKKTTTPKKETIKKEIKEPKKIEIIEEDDELEAIEEIEVETETETENEDLLLEKTLIFDGKQNENLKEVVSKLEEKNIVLEDRVIKRSKAKKVIIIILSVVILLSLAYTTYYVLDKEVIDKVTTNYNIKQKVDRNKKKKIEYTEVKDDDEYEKIIRISLEEFETKVLNNEDFTVMITQSACYYCLEFEPIVNEVLTEKDKVIYEINISLITTKETERFREYYEFTKTPTIFTIKDNKVISELIGYKEKNVFLEYLDNNM